MRRFLLRFFLAAAVTLVASALETRAQATAAKQADEDQSSTAPRKTDSAAVPQQQAEGQMPASGETTTQEAKAFTGNIVQENQKWVLKDPVTKVSYKLDDAAKAKQYAGKQVKVTGKLDMNSNTIQIETIQVLR